MIYIEYTNEYIEGEDGPNFYWRGEPKDYLRLINDIHDLGSSDGVELQIDQFDYITVLSSITVVMKASDEGNILCTRQNDKVLVDLKCSIWRDFISLLLTVSFFKSHQYIEFDELNLVEDANFIISSELSQ